MTVSQALRFARIAFANLKNVWRARVGRTKISYSHPALGAPWNHETFIVSSKPCSRQRSAEVSAAFVWLGISVVG
jgi:hypothetical protein